MLLKTFLPSEKNPVYDYYSELNIDHTFPQNNFNFKTV